VCCALFRFWWFLCRVSVFKAQEVEAASAFARWESKIKAFEEKDKNDPPPKNGLLFVGSSSIVRWDLPKSFPDMPVINRGFGGSQIVDSIHFADRIVFPHEPSVIVFYAGDNDIASGKSAERVFNDYVEFVTLIRKRLPKTKVVYIPIKPSIRRWSMWDKMKDANARIETYAKQHLHLEYVDIATPMLSADGPPPEKWFVSDGLHLSEAGYALWTSLVMPHLK
jgi:lysophospholipase L1-like esterase